MMSDKTDTGKKRVERTLELVLRPISKILIKNGFSVQMCLETLKRTLVRSALDDTGATDSQISLRTGIHRKDVKRLRADIAAGSDGKFPIQGLAIVLATWTEQEPFCDQEGNGRILAARNGTDTPTFEALVKASKVDLAPATVKAEMLAQDLICAHPNGDIELLSATFVGRSGDAALEAFQATIGDHIRVAAENVLSPAGTPRQFDQVLRYSHLSEASVAELETTAREMAGAYLKTLNTLAHRLQSQDDSSGSLANGRFVTGVYVAPTPPVEDGPPTKKTQT